MPNIKNLTDYLIAAQSQGFFIALEAISVILILLFIGFIIYFIKATGYYKIRLWQDLMEFYNFRSYGKEQVNKRWSKIRGRLEIPSEAEYKLAILEAEDILDETLSRMGCKGETLEERLKLLAPDQLSNRDQLLEAHRARNSIIHDPDYQIPSDKAKGLLEIYEKSLQDLEVL